MEQKIEGGCDVLLDKEQSLIREGMCCSYGDVLQLWGYVAMGICCSYGDML